MLTEDEDEITNFPNGNTDDTDLEALEQQVNQIRESLESHEERANSSLTNGDIVMTEPSEKVIIRGANRSGKSPKGRRAGSDLDTDTDEDDSNARRGDNKNSSRAQTTDDESYIQTDDDTVRTDEEDMEWQESIKRWVNR